MGAGQPKRYELQVATQRHLSVALRMHASEKVLNLLNQQNANTARQGFLFSLVYALFTHCPPFSSLRHLSLYLPYLPLPLPLPATLLLPPSCYGPKTECQRMPKVTQNSHRFCSLHTKQDLYYCLPPPAPSMYYYCDTL